MKKATKTATKSKSKSVKKVITPDMGVDKELIDFGKKVLAEAIAEKAKEERNYKETQNE